MLILLIDGKPWLGRLIHRQALASVLKGFKSPATRSKHWQQQRSPSSSHQELAGPHMLKKRRRCCGTWARWFSRRTGILAQIKYVVVIGWEVTPTLTNAWNFQDTWVWLKHTVPTNPHNIDHGHWSKVLFQSISYCITYLTIIPG